MYLGTWIGKKNKISCNVYMDLKIKQNPMYMNLKKKIFLCVAQGVEVDRQKKNFWQLINFGNFVQIKVAKFKLNHLG